MYDGIAKGLLFAGGVLTMLTVAANRYHSRAYKGHIDRLEQHRRDDEYDAIAQEVRQFHDDRRVDLAVNVLLLEPVAAFCLITGVFLLLW